MLDQQSISHESSGVLKCIAEKLNLYNSKIGQILKEINLINRSVMMKRIYFVLLVSILFCSFFVTSFASEACKVVGNQAACVYVYCGQPLSPEKMADEMNVIQKQYFNKEQNQIHIYVFDNLAKTPKNSHEFFGMSDADCDKHQIAIFDINNNTGCLDFTYRKPGSSKMVDCASYIKKSGAKGENFSPEEKKFGEKPIPSPWDGTVSIVKDYLINGAKDPSSIKCDNWSKVYFNKSDGWIVQCRWYGKNSYGAVVPSINWFVIRYGKVVEMKAPNAYK